MKKKILITTGILLLIGAFFSGKIFADMSKIEKQNEESYSFREVLDEVYFPALHDGRDIFDNVVSVPNLDTWYLVDGGEERNKKVLEDLEKAKDNISYYKIENPDGIALKEIVLNNIEIQIKIHELIDTYSMISGNDFTLKNNFLDLFTDEVENLSLGIKDMNDNLGKYYTK